MTKTQPGTRKRTASATPAPGAYPLSYSEYLVAQTGEAKRKGERTRLRLKAAAAKLLGEVGYRDLRVSDIHEEAGVSNALFYVYFKNKDEISHEVLEGFLTFLEDFSNRDEPAASREEAIYLGNLRYAEIFKANAGLMRCVFQFVDEFADFAANWHRWNLRWSARATKAMAKLPAVAFQTEYELDVAVAALGAMVDGLLRLAFIERNPRVVDTPIGNDPTALARLLTQLWVRGLLVQDLPATPGQQK